MKNFLQQKVYLKLTEVDTFEFFDSLAAKIKIAQVKTFGKEITWVCYKSLAKQFEFQK